MTYTTASIFHQDKMIEIQRVMEKLRIDLEYHEPPNLDIASNL